MSNLFRTILLVSLALVLHACALSFTDTSPTLPENDKLAEIMARGTLVVATDVNYPPFSRLVEGEPRAVGTKCAASQYTGNQMEGFDAATGAEIARRLGVEPCFVSPQWSQLIAGNWADGWDISVGSMTPTFERMKVLYFAQPYFATPISVFVHSDNSTYQKPEDLNGKRIGTCVGCTYEQYLTGTLRLPGPEIVFRIKNPEIIAYENELPAFDDLSLGDGVKLDAIVTQSSAGDEAIRAGRPLRRIEPPLFYAYAAPAIDKKSSRDPAAFVQRVTEIVQQMHADGTLSSFSLQWLGLDRTQDASSFDIGSLNQ